MLLSSNKKSESLFGKAVFAEQLFTDLSAQARRNLENIGKKVVFEKNQMIYDVGESPQRIYVLLSGEAHLFVNLSSRKRCLIRPIESDEVLGLPEMLGDFSYQIGVQTHSFCTCDCFLREDFLSFLENNSKTTFRLLEILSFNLQEGYQNFLSSTFYTS